MDIGNDRLMDSGVSRRVFVHPYGLCGSDHVGSRTRVWAFAHVLAGAKVGRTCNICDMHTWKAVLLETGPRPGHSIRISSAKVPPANPSCRVEGHECETGFARLCRLVISVNSVGALATCEAVARRKAKTSSLSG